MPSIINASITNNGIVQSADASGILQLQSDGVTGLTISSGGAVSTTRGPITSLVTGTLQTVTSGTSVNFSSIPSWVKRITVNISGLSGVAGLSAGVQLGSGGLVTTGYTTGQVSPPGATYTTITDKIVTFGTSAAASTVSGIAILTHLGNNIWSGTSMMNRTTDNLIQLSVGTITLSGVLDRVSIVTTASTFDAGSVNIMYE